MKTDWLIFSRFSNRDENINPNKNVTDLDSPEIRGLYKHFRKLIVLTSRSSIRFKFTNLIYNATTLIRIQGNFNALDEQIYIKKGFSLSNKPWNNLMYVFTKPTARAKCDIRSIFKRRLTRLS